MYAVCLLVICNLSPLVRGSDYLIAVYGRSSVQIKSDKTGGSVRITTIIYNETQAYKLEVPDLDRPILQQISTTLGYDASATLISCSNSATNLTVYGGDSTYKYNVFSPLPVTALGTRYVVSSCIQAGAEYAVLVITSYKLKADVSIRFATNVDFSYDGRRYNEGDTFKLTIERYKTFTFRDRHDLSGTRIDSSQPIAVFSGTANSTTVYTYTQLLPVELFSDEYVVAVDSSMPPIQLQIIGEDNDFEITFNNGSSASASSSIMNRLLRQNEACYFTSSKPVMATLCRSAGIQTGFVLVPPTSLYGDHNDMQIEYTTAIVTHSTVKINVSNDRVSGSWKNIPNSNYKVGMFSLTSPGAPSYTDLKYSGMVITFRPESFYANGLSLAKKDQPITNPAETFIINVPKSLDVYVKAVGRAEAFYQLWCPGNETVKTRNTFPYVEDYFQIRFYSLCYIMTNNELHFFLQGRRNNEVMSVPILPVSKLGKKYVVPSYDGSLFVSFYITLVTGHWAASVDLKKSDGSVSRYDLVEYQQRRIQIEASGMIVSSSRELAVFIESKYAVGLERYTYTQLSPSEDFGNEYVLAVGSLATKHFIFVDNFTESYFINITCLFNDTTIIFNDGLTVTVGYKKFYHKDIMVNGSLHFTSSKPVMAYLCLKADLHHDDKISEENPCTILHPVELYDDSAVISIPANADLKIITKRYNEDFHAFKVYRFYNTRLIPHWKNIQNTDYKVGSASADTGTLFMKSTHKFSVIINGFYIHNFPENHVLLSISTSSTLQLRTPLHPTTAGINLTALVTGCVCAFIIIVLGTIVVVLLFRRRRNTESKPSTETQKRQETSFEADQHVLETQAPGTNVKMEEVHNYSELNFQGQDVNDYERMGQTSEDKTSEYTNM